VSNDAKLAVAWSTKHTGETLAVMAIRRTWFVDPENPPTAVVAGIDGNGKVTFDDWTYAEPKGFTQLSTQPLQSNSAVALSNAFNEYIASAERDAGGFLFVRLWADL
jgi:hypothetical protein